MGNKTGKLIDRVFDIFRCPVCGFAFVSNPWTDFEKIYSRQYYEGRGADDLADYMFELEHPDQAIRQYEWPGLVKVVTGLLSRRQEIRWMDYGCGSGGLVRFGRQAGIGIDGFDEGWIADEARRRNIPLLDRRALEAVQASFDVVTAIEVMEHVLDPLETLRHIHKLLKPGGLFYCTTGNAYKQRNQLLDWPYIKPEVHISFFEPFTLETALRRTGFRVEYPGYVPGHSQIIQSRVLKNLGAKQRARWQTWLPWRIVGPLIDSHVGFTSHPIGWAEK